MEMSALRTKKPSEEDNESKQTRNIWVIAERHLKQIIHNYEELNPEKPLTRKFQNPPPSQLLTLCMESPPENDFRPRDILKAIEHIVPKAFEKKQVSKIQFENTNVILGTAGRKNSGELFPLHRHDDVIVEDEKRNLRRALNKNKILDTFINPTNLSKIP
ncbi:putative uncharacterized protein C19orf81 homolog [Ranitomeya imitator]|uniref:putative uncharacterized protein C19orf81 homolog n=1 Tax=Ranitomeya imitator TaxID=111125 RepID=UPI0037E751A2